MRPPTDERLWRELVSVSLGNGNSIYNEGDKVGVVRDWIPPTADTQLSQGQKAVVLRDIEGAYNKDPLSTRSDVRSVQWVGRILAQHMELDMNDAGARGTVKRILEEWEKDGSITKVSVRDHAKGRYVQGYKVGAKSDVEEEEVPF
jgi:hypothetical protein